MCLGIFNVCNVSDGIAAIPVSPGALKCRKISVLSLKWTFILIFNHYIKSFEASTESFFQLNWKKRNRKTCKS